MITTTRLRTFMLLMGSWFAFLSVAVVVGCSSTPTIARPSQQDLAVQLKVVDEVWSSLDSVLNRRADLTSNVIASLRRPGFEPPLLFPVMDAWGKVAGVRRSFNGPPFDGAKISEVIDAEKQLGFALEKLMAASDKNPNFPNRGAVQMLASMLQPTTSQIEALSGRYNAAAEKYNSLLAEVAPENHGSFAKRPLWGTQ